MLLKNLQRISIVGVVLIAASLFGAGGASAASKVSPSSSPTSPISALSMSDAEGGGGSPSMPALSTSEIVSNVGAVLRNAGGGGILIRILDVIVRTASVCPACFIP